MAKGLSKKELRQPDEFITFWSSAAQFAAQRRQALTAGTVALGVVVAGAMGISAWREHSAQVASQELERVQKIGFAELLPAEPGAAKPDDGVPHFKTERERAAAAAHEAETFVSSHGSSPLRDKAQLLRASYLVDAGKLDEAVGLYGQLLGRELDPSLRVIAREDLGLAYEAKAELDKADKEYATLADESAVAGGFYRDRALVDRARVAERKGNPKDAEKLYREVLDKIPASTLREEVSNRLAALEAK